MYVNPFANSRKVTIGRTCPKFAPLSQEFVIIMLTLLSPNPWQKEKISLLLRSSKNKRLWYGWQKYICISSQLPSTSLKFPKIPKIYIYIFLENRIQCFHQMPTPYTNILIIIITTQQVRTRRRKPA